MCGIVGFHTEDPAEEEQYAALKRIFEQSKIRGLHAFGFAFPWQDYLRWEKYRTLSEALRGLDVYRPVTLIGHTRYSTSGDYETLENNQPVVLPGQAVVFNGVIDMGTKEEMEERYGIKMRTDNDGEIFLNQANPEEFVRNMKGSFAGLFVKDGEFYFLRNPRRPGWFIKEFGATYVASTADIFKRAGFKGKPTELAPYQTYRLKDL